MDLKTIAGLSKKALLWIGKSLSACLKSFEQAGITCDPGLAAVWLACLLVMFGSACWAYSIARSRRRTPWLFLLLGFLLPLAVPLLMMFLLSTEFELEERRQARLDRRRRKKEEQGYFGKKRLAEEEARRAEEERSSSSPWNADRFKAIQRREDGSPAGPWNVTYGSAAVVVREILEIQERLLVVAAEGGDGAPLKMRIPFDKIRKWEERAEDRPEKAPVSE